MRYHQIKILCENYEVLTFEEFSRFFYYINNIYKLIYFGLNREYSNINLERGVGKEKIPSKEHNLKISKIRKESPIEFWVLIPVLTGILTSFIEIIRLVKDMRDWKLDKENKLLENENLRLINEKLKDKASKDKLLSNEIINLLKLDEVKIREVIESKENS